MAKCTIHIKDEINCKLDGLELTLKKKLSDKFKYEIPGARYQPSVRLGRWDGKVSFFTAGGATFINLLPEILPLLEANNYDVELNDQRTYSTVFEFDAVDEKSFADINWPKGHVAAGTPIILRDYQIEIINNFLTNTQGIQEVATGAGKTIITAALSSRVEKYGRSIIIVPSKSLVTQTEEDYINMGLDVGVLFGDRKDYFKTHTICTWQSLLHLMKNTENNDTDVTIQEFLDGVVCVMVDEAHAAKADALKTLLSGPFARVPIRWGLTGTIPKEDYAFQALHCCIGTVINKLTASELQAAGYLSNCHVNIVQMVDYVEYKDYQSELKYLTTTNERIAYLAKIVDKIKQSGNTLILVDRIATGKLLQVELSSLFSLLSDKPDIVFISGNTKTAERKEEYDQIATAQNKITIATYGVAAVGINIPRIFNLVLFEPGKSFIRVIQSIGRGIRKAADKDHVEIYDITSTCKFSKRHLTKRKQYYKEANYPFSIEKIDWQKA